MVCFSRAMNRVDIDRKNFFIVSFCQNLFFIAVLCIVSGHCSYLSVRNFSDLLIEDIVYLSITLQLVFLLRFRAGRLPINSLAPFLTLQRVNVLSNRRCKLAWFNSNNRQNYQKICSFWVSWKLYAFIGLWTNWGATTERCFSLEKM